MDGLISVIIPAYNREKVIEECILSVTAQSYGNFEIILVDDGSADKTAEICEKFAQSDKRIRFFAADHGGVSAARNKALDEAMGEFVFFLDSDDCLHPLCFEEMISGIEKYGGDIAATQVFSVSESRWERVREKMASADTVCESHLVSNAQAIDLIFTSRSPLIS